MADIHVENIVTSTKISEELDLKRLADHIPDSKYNPEEFPGLILHFELPKTAALLFSNGKAICTGAKNMKDANETMHKIISKLKGAGISVMEKPEIGMQNIVASSDVGKELHLSSISKSLWLEKVEYKPEEFPGLVYRPGNLGAVLLVFSSGKIVCTGVKSLEDASNVINAFKDKLSSLGVT